MTFNILQHQEFNNKAKKKKKVNSIKQMKKKKEDKLSDTKCEARTLYIKATADCRIKQQMNVGFPYQISYQI